MRGKLYSRETEINVYDAVEAEFSGRILFRGDTCKLAGKWTMRYRSAQVAICGGTVTLPLAGNGLLRTGAIATIELQDCTTQAEK